MAIIIKEASKAPLAISGLANDMARIYLSYNQQKLDQADREQQMIWRREDRQLQLDDAAADRDAQMQRHADTTRIAQGQLDATIENNALLRAIDQQRIDNQASQFDKTHTRGVVKDDRDYSLGLGQLSLNERIADNNQANAEARLSFDVNSEKNRTALGWATHGLAEDTLGFKREQHTADVGLRTRALENDEERTRIQRDEALARISLNDAQVAKVQEETDALKQDRNFQQSSYDTIMKMDSSLFTGGEEGRKQAANQAALGDFSSWQDLLIDSVSADESTEAFKFRQTNAYWKTVLSQQYPTWSDEQIAAKALEYTRANYVSFASGLIGATPKALSTTTTPGLENGTDGSLAVGTSQNDVEVSGTRTLTAPNGVSETITAQELKDRAKAQNVSVAEYIAGLQQMGVKIQ